MAGPEVSRPQSLVGENGGFVLDRNNTFCIVKMKSKQVRVLKINRISDDGIITAKKSNGAMMSGVLGSGSQTPPAQRKSRFAVFGKLFRPWKWKRTKKSDKFEKTSRALERKMSVRANRDDLLKKGILLPDGTSTVGNAYVLDCMEITD
uniref:Phosphatase and actin regulator n=1 Tax=Strigamia maritima TaxID=126957 RepID=T1J081_STRMM